MPYKSEAQRRYFHWAVQHGKIKPKTVKEYDKESKGKKLPERLHPKKRKKTAGLLFKLGFLKAISTLE